MDDTVINMFKYEDIWALIEPDESAYEPIRVGSGIWALPFIVLTSHPRPQRWDRYHCRLLAHLLAMDLWNWPVTYIAKYVNYSILDPTLIIFQPTS